MRVLYRKRAALFTSVGAAQSDEGCEDFGDGFRVGAGKSSGELGGG
jgi:hypothetical protein